MRVITHDVVGDGYILLYNLIIGVLELFVEILVIRGCEVLFCPSPG